MKRPPRPFLISLRPPSDISTARTSAWSPPTRAWDTLRDVVAVCAPVPGAPVLVRGPGGRIGWRNLPLARFLPLRLISASLDGDAQAARFAVRGWHIWPLRPAPPA